MDIKETFRLKTEKVILPEAKVEMAETLYPGKGRGEVRKTLMEGLKKRLFLLGILSLMIVAGMAVKDVTRGVNSHELTRQPMNQGVTRVQIVLSAYGEEQMYELKLGSAELTDEDIDRLHAEAEKTLDKYILGENTDFLSVSRDLILPEEISVGDETLYLTWSSDRGDVLDAGGHVKDPYRDTEETVTLRARIKYGPESRVYERIISVVPKQLTPWEAAYQQAVQQLEELEHDRQDKEYSLPTEIGDVTVRVVQDNTHYLLLGVGLSVVVMTVGYLAFFEGISEKRKKRVDKGAEDYKDFIRKLILLLSAGMSVRLAWGKLCRDYEGAAPDSLLTEVLQVSRRELESGIREDVCYRRFGERMGSRPYERLVEILTQQSVRGVSHVSTVLETELREVCESEKEQVKVRAERAGTALLLPIMGLLSIVFLVIMIPAFQGLGV